MATLSFDLPDEVFSARYDSPEQFLGALRLAAAMFWYGRGHISQGRAAEIAGLDRTDFLLAISREGQDIFPVDFDDLDRELNRAGIQTPPRIGEGG